MFNSFFFECLYIGQAMLVDYSAAPFFLARLYTDFVQVFTIHESQGR